MKQTSLLRKAEPDELHKLPCHNQIVEQIFKVVSESSMRAANSKEREGIIQNILASREELPKFENKSQFKMKWNNRVLNPIN